MEDAPRRLCFGRGAGRRRRRCRASGPQGRGDQLHRDLRSDPAAPSRQPQQAHAAPDRAYFAVARELGAQDLDLAGAAGASRRAPAGEKIRVLDIQEVGESVRKRIGLLKKGETPAALGLGEEVTASLAQSLLVMLYRRWCEEGQSRAYPRHGASGTAQICSGMAAVQQFVTGGTFRMPGASRELSQVQHEQIATLGRVVARQDEHVPAANFVAETWQIKDESASGVRLQRVDPAATSRLVLGQLLGIRLADAKAFLLCTVRWLSVSQQFELCIGVQILPGVPLGVAVRGAHASSEPYAPALMLPAVAALKAPETLVLPSGWFKPERAIEVYTDSARQVRLASVIDRGADFE